MINNSIDVVAFEAFESSRQSARGYDVIKKKIELFKVCLILFNKFYFSCFYLYIHNLNI